MRHGTSSTQAMWGLGLLVATRGRCGRGMRGPVGPPCPGSLPSRVLPQAAHLQEYFSQPVAHSSGLFTSSFQKLLNPTPLAKGLLWAPTASYTSPSEP